MGSFSVTQLGDPADKVGKDDNFRGLASYGNVLYYTKGSGSNGVSTVYFLDITGKACPSGVGLPVPGAPLPTSPLAYDPATVGSAGLPWAPATDGLRNITGQVNRDGTVTVWAITSTVSGGGDQGADPNKLVAITDRPSAAAPAAGESFRTVRAAGYGQVLRGVSFTPGTRS